MYVIMKKAMTGGVLGTRILNKGERCDLDEDVLKMIGPDAYSLSGPHWDAKKDPHSIRLAELKDNVTEARELVDILKRACKLAANDADDLVSSASDAQDNLNMMTGRGPSGPEDQADEGVIDNLTVLDRELSEAEVKELPLLTDPNTTIAQLRALAAKRTSPIFSAS